MPLDCPKIGVHLNMVIFDPETIEDTATFESPHQYSRGLAFTLVNGKAVFAEGTWTGRLPGKPIFGEGRKELRPT